MRLREKDKDELRICLENELEKAPDDSRIHINKDLLEQLIFYENFGYNSETKERINFKIPLWTPNILRKLDLSELSFNGVLWNYQELIKLSSTPKKFIPKFEIRKYVFKSPNQIILLKIADLSNPKEIVCDEKENYTKIEYVDDIHINFSNANAKIDFSKAISLNSKEKPTMYGCWFENTDLSSSNLELCKSAIWCDFLNCNLTPKHINSGCLFHSSDFTDNDFSDFTIEAEQYLKRFECANFSNTKINITGTTETLKQEGPIHHDSVARGISSQNLKNCYINGKRVKTVKEKEETKENAISEYQEYTKQMKKQLKNELKKALK